MIYNYMYFIPMIMSNVTSINNSNNLHLTKQEDIVFCILFIISMIIIPFLTYYLLKITNEDN